VAIIEPLFMILGAQATEFDQVGMVQGRTGNRTGHVSPRNTYQAADGRWMVVSASTPSIQLRVMSAIGRPDLAVTVDDPEERAGLADDVDEAVAKWFASHSSEEAMQILTKAEAAVGHVYTIEDIMNDPQYQALRSVVRLPDGDLGSVAMHNLFFRMSRT